MEILDDMTIYMTETQKMLGYETDWAKKKREYRKALETDKKDIVRTKKDNVRQEIDIDKDIDIDINNSVSVFKKPTINEIKDYCIERNNNIDPETFYNFYESKVG